MLVDEPMVGLDPRGAKLIKAVFRRMSENGVAILMSTHTLEVAEEMCDRISIILKGPIIAHGTVEELQRMAGKPNEELTPVLPEAHRRKRAAGDRRDRVMAAAHTATHPFPYLLLPSFWASRNRARRREKGDLLRGVMFGGIGSAVFAALFWGAFWVTRQAAQVRRAGRLPDADRAGVAVPDLPLLPRVQRHRRPLSIFSVGRLAADPGGADARAGFSTPASPRPPCRPAWMVVVFLVPVLAGVGHGAVCVAGVLDHGAPHRHAVCRHPRRHRRAPSRCCSSTSFRRGGPATS